MISAAAHSPDARYVDRIDAAGRSSLGRPAPLADEIERRVHESPPACIVIDQLGRIGRRWKNGDPARFFGRICPTMLQLGVTAYWGIDSSLGRAFAEDVRQITQCMVDVRGGRLRVLKAEGRPRALEGLTHRLQLDDSGRIIVSSGPAGGRLARGLIAVRQQLGLTQQELASVAEITPSAISQAETGGRGLSLDTVVSIADRLELPVDRLLGTTMAPTYGLHVTTEVVGSETATWWHLHRIRRLACVRTWCSSASSKRWPRRSSTVAQCSSRPLRASCKSISTTTARCSGPAMS